MGLFNTILQKLGIQKKDEPVSGTASAAVAAKPAAPAPAKPAAPAAPVKPAAPPASGAPKPAVRMEEKDEIKEIKAANQPVVKAISEVDVVKQLEVLGKGKGLDWKVSIVDLLKLLDIDSSFAARKELATELGCPADLMGDSAKMNTWLHKEVLRQVAANGGNIPKELLD